MLKSSFVAMLFVGALTVTLSSKTPYVAAGSEAQANATAKDHHPVPQCSSEGVCKSDGDCCSGSQCMCGHPGDPCHCQHIP
jgi:hypothetical protein